jgi:hypothetical protein
MHIMEADSDAGEVATLVEGHIPSAGHCYWLGYVAKIVYT